MAWYKVKHSCGHNKEHWIVGKFTKRNLQIAMLERSACQDCLNAGLDEPLETRILDFDTWDDAKLIHEFLSARGYSIERLERAATSWRLIFTE